MRSSIGNFCLILAFAVSGGVVVSGHAEPAKSKPKPVVRSFRPMVPIKQNVRGGLDQMKSQTVSVKIPPPPIPEHAPVVDLATPSPTPTVPETSLGSDPSPEFVGPADAKTVTAKAGSDLPPEPVKEEKLSAPEAKEKINVTADSPPEPAPAENGTEKEKPTKGPTLKQLHAEAHSLAEKKLTYVFGADDPDSGGLDCSSTIQYLLNKIGVKNVPRTSYDQYAWLKKNKMLDDVYGKSAQEKLFKKLSPGDLIFWGGTYNSGHRVSHVMLYMGYDKARDKHYIFGARGKSVKGLTGCGVDIFELSQQKGRLIAHGKIPGLIY